VGRERDEISRRSRSLLNVDAGEGISISIDSASAVSGGAH
jgi:hypothetical protein